MMNPLESGGYIPLRNSWTSMWLTYTNLLDSLGTVVSPHLGTGRIDGGVEALSCVQCDSVLMPRTHNTQTAMWVLWEGIEQHSMKSYLPPVVCVQSHSKTILLIPIWNWDQCEVVSFPGHYHSWCIRTMACMHIVSLYVRNCQIECLTRRLETELDANILTGTPGLTA